MTWWSPCGVGLAGRVRSSRATAIVRSSVLRCACVRGCVFCITIKSHDARSSSDFAVVAVGVGVGVRRARGLVAVGVAVAVRVGVAVAVRAVGV